AIREEASVRRSAAARVRGVSAAECASGEDQVSPSLGHSGRARRPDAVKYALSRVRYGFHDTALGRVVEHAYHVVATDEQREDYQVMLWDALHQYGPKDVEQRWFPGAHANVGGGYQDDLLPDPPLRWIAENARALGLKFNDEFAMQLGQPACKA